MTEPSAGPGGSPTPDEPVAPLTARSFTAWPAWADLSLDTVYYGPDIPTESELRLLGNLDGKRVLELGCGGGPVAVAMAKQGARVVAVDTSAEQIAHARRLAEREEVKVELHHGDLADLAFVRADAMDAAVSVYTLGAVEDPNRVFRQVHRVLKPEAPLVLSLPHPAFRAVDPLGDPPQVRRAYADRTPVPWPGGSEQGSDFPLTISELFTYLGRANFRVDTLLEPAAATSGSRSRHWSPAMRWLPPTLIIRARKLGI